MIEIRDDVESRCVRLAAPPAPASRPGHRHRMAAPCETAAILAATAAGADHSIPFFDVRMPPASSDVAALQVLLGAQVGVGDEGGDETKGPATMPTPHRRP